MARQQLWVCTEGKMHFHMYFPIGQKGCSQGECESLLKYSQTIWQVLCRESKSQEL